MIWSANANIVKSGSLVAWQFSSCSWICKSGATWHLIFWKPRQISLWISYLNWWI